jgi:predicted RNA-binding protein YlqC (UPF0109 family)
MEIKMAANFKQFEEDLGNFVTLLTRGLVDHKDEVECKTLAGDDNAVVEIHCNPRDYGLLIGKQGANINAMTRLCALTFRSTFRYVKLQVVGAKDYLNQKR